MTLPFNLLKAAVSYGVLVELKNGETYNGHLAECDHWMNISLRDVICTSRDGDKFWKMPECYIRGNNIKYLRIPDEVLSMVKDNERAKQMKMDNVRAPRGRSGPGRGGFVVAGGSARGGGGARGGPAGRGGGVSGGRGRGGGAGGGAPHRGRGGMRGGGSGGGGGSRPA